MQNLRSTIMSTAFSKGVDSTPWKYVPCEGWTELCLQDVHISFPPEEAWMVVNTRISSKQAILDGLWKKFLTEEVWGESKKIIILPRPITFCPLWKSNFSLPEAWYVHIWVRRDKIPRTILLSTTLHFLGKLIHWRMPKTWKYEINLTLLQVFNSH